MATQVNLHRSLQCASSSLPFVALSTLYFLWSNCFDLMPVVKIELMYLLTMVMMNWGETGMENFAHSAFQGII